MKFIDEFRDPAAVKRLIAEIGRVLERVDPARQPLQIMEVCGGHTHAIFRFGLDKLLPEGIEFVHGPGCPVCVLPRGRIDDAITLASRAPYCAATATPCGCRGSRVPCSMPRRPARMCGSSIRPWTRWRWPGNTRTAR